MGYERAKRFPWIAAVLVAASIALAACAPGGATGSNNAADDGRPSANQPVAAVNGSGDDTGTGDDGHDDEARDDENREVGQDDDARDDRDDRDDLGDGRDDSDDDSDEHDDD
jgi:hypothetical protein